MIKNDPFGDKLIQAAYSLELIAYHLLSSFYQTLQIQSASSFAISYKLAYKSSFISSSAISWLIFNFVK